MKTILIQAVTSGEQYPCAVEAVSMESCPLGTGKIEPPQADPQGEGSRERIESTPGAVRAGKEGKTIRMRNHVTAAAAS
jgi:hypothetical protein